MKIIISKLIILLLLVFCLNGFAQTEKRKLDNPVFTFNNALNQKQYPVLSIEEQADFLKNLGFDGMECKETDGLLQAVDVFKKKGMKIYANYIKVDIDAKEPYLPSWKEVIPKLKGTDMILWLHFHSNKYKPSDEVADDIIVPIVQELADFAKPFGLRIAIYHHVGFLSEKVEDSYRIASKVNRENVGSVFNTCHFLKTDSAENLEKMINLTFPKLFVVSIAGANVGDTKNMDWDQLIQPVGKGTFDNYRVLELLKEKGYKGPIGIQCWAIQEMPKDFLAQTMSAISSFRARYKIPNNELSNQEKKEGWKLLFDGKSTTQWRAINEKSFPKVGWKVETGELCISGDNVLAESKKIGDIVTKKMYSNFELAWDWKMLTKGGNSGVKYFVVEGLSENPKHGEGLEYQLLDDKNHPWMLDGKMKANDYHTVGSLYELYAASADKRPSPLGLWNQSRIVSNNNHIEHWLNGKKVLEYERGSNDFKEQVAKSKMNAIPGFGLVKEGHILFQDHGSIVHFRNIKINELK